MSGGLIFSLILNIVLLGLFCGVSIVLIALLEAFREGSMCDKVCPYKVDPGEEGDR